MSSLSISFLPKCTVQLHYYYSMGFQVLIAKQTQIHALPIPVSTLVTAFWIIHETLATDVCVLTDL